MTSSGAAGLLRPNSRLLEGVDPPRVRVELDVGTQRFLRDHFVDSRALLSTVMGIETIASAAGLMYPDRSIAAVTDVVIGPPYLLKRQGRGGVYVTLSGDARLHCVLTSDPEITHFSAVVELGDPPLAPARRVIPSRRPIDPHVDADSVYALYFHGPSFRVVHSAHFSGGVMVGHLTLDLPSLVDPPIASAMAPLLIELCLQTAGLWELAVLGRMGIPDGIDTVLRYTNADTRDATPLSALVFPRLIGAGRYVFDAQVIDALGDVQLEVRGYRTTEFEHPVEESAAATIREQLGEVGTSWTELDASARLGAGGEDGLRLR